MATTVFANGNAVATSTSDHVAHITAPDFRYPPGTSPAQAVGLWNEIDSLHIASGYPTKTEFGGGKIWTTPVKVGEPPKSMPVDGFLGVKNGGMINSYACAAPGQGSKNVFVEAQRVQRFLDLTEQNAKNSPGLINDQAGADAARKAFKPVVPDQAEDDAAKAKSKSKGGSDGKDGKGDDAGKEQVKPQAGPPTAEKCTLWSVDMTETSFPKPRPQSAAITEKDAYIEIVADKNKVSFKSQLAKNCGSHAEYHCTDPKWDATGETAEFKAPKTAERRTEFENWVPGLAGGILKLLAFADEKPKEYRISISGCEKANFNRTVRHFRIRYDATRPQIKLHTHNFREAQKGEKGEVFLGFVFFINKFLACGVTNKFNMWQGDIGIAFGWEEVASSYYAYAKCQPTGTLTIFSWAQEWRFPFETWPVPFPPVKAIQLAIKSVNWVCEKLGVKLFSLYFYLGLKADAKVTVAGAGLRKRYMGRWEWGGLDFTVAGSVTGEVGVSLDALQKTWNVDNPANRADPQKEAVAFRARGYAQINFQIIGKKTTHEPPKISAQIIIRPLKLGILVTWDLTVLLPKAGEPVEAQSWWQRAKDKMRQYAIDSFGKNVLKGQIDKSVELFETLRFPADPGWLIPIPFLE